MWPRTAKETIAGREAGLRKPIEPTSDKPLNIIRENAAKQLFQEHGVASAAFMALLILEFIKPEVNPVNLVIILLSSVQWVESLLVGISVPRVITQQSGCRAL